MQVNRREISFFVIAVLAAGVAIWYFYRTFREEKAAEETDIYALLAPDPYALLAINRPTVFTRSFMEQEQLRNIFELEAPDVFFSIMASKARLPFFLFSFHEQGAVLYARASTAQVSRINREILNPLFYAYRSQKIDKYGVQFVYYSDTDNRFMGYYHSRGILVVSYSRTLLEEVARRHLQKIEVPEDIRNGIAAFDKKSPVNILFRPDSLNLYVTTTEGKTWRIGQQWLTADLFRSEGNICAFGFLRYRPECDSLYVHLADTLALRLKERYPLPDVTFEVNREEDFVYFTGCISGD